MDIGSILLILAVAVVVIAYVRRPFTQNTARSVSEEEHKLSSILAERDRVLDALNELDFDNNLGKVAQEVYQSQRVMMLERGAELLKEIDKYDEGLAERDALKVVIATGRAAVARGEDPIEAMIAARKNSSMIKTKGAKFCPNCGEPAEAGDKFCTNCGEAL